MLVFMTLALGCVRAKPPRTVTVPESLEQTQEFAAENILTGDAAKRASLSPTIPTLGITATLPPPTPTPTTTSPPTTTVEIPPIGATTTSSARQPPHSTDEVVHVVKPGETLYSIAERYGTTVLAIIDKNDLPYSNAIRVNQELVIPVGHKPSGTLTPYTVKHMVKQGESLAQLARAYRTTISDIIAENPHIKDPNDLSPGTTLTIRTGTAPPVRLHVVAPGQNLYAIARRYGVSVETLVRANGLRNPNTIHVGQQLVVP
ncbi:MAG: LysM peptidoglycan-binding domain-containing protein [Anaerolineales bacterium]